ncbi:hypothetical protein [Peredibacter starrii]|uniref:Uncharacterized protein n=1 Tax=Peredibacter starrii TaxID=28202 RepID=A0AAX4HVT1_9BACT|nr:hypothetical protein [Peredibacter starrii]WPU67110.1 hypothetical protein SOO65_10125 [Peredibacter starrii]
MKMLAVSLSLLFVSAANASMVLEVPTDHWAERNEAKFEVNKEQGRAWVTLMQIQPRRGGHKSAGPGEFARETRAKVPGMSYDEASKSIVLDQDGRIVECATVRTRGVSIFKYDKITPTGCKLIVKKAKKAQDDGFRTRYISVTQVHLIAE